ncbi:hypothetical protein Pint_34004 [Pistacia integerrima]|uniref:Uncharacterized protein n=1 Tax=Pistacia integerrima TaxID=434235 RepID=A0ACC0X729_9ROSI|nr:hypothetical protein Pint_34004 [Pistacia integerrima]
MVCKNVGDRIDERKLSRLQPKVEMKLGAYQSQTILDLTHAKRLKGEVGRMTMTTKVSSNLGRRECHAKRPKQKKETGSNQKVPPRNIEDFDAIICNNGSELYYLWRDTVADLDYEAHVEYKWPGENERSMVIRLARTEHKAQVDDIVENVDACDSRC